MGCHTWFANILNPQPSQEEIRERVLNDYTEYLKDQEIFLDVVQRRKKATNDHKWLMEAYPEDYTPDELKWRIKLFRRLIKKIKDGKAEKAIWRVYGRLEVLKLYKGKFYRDLKGDINKFGDCFRVGNYPEDILTSYDEFLEYYSDPKNRCRNIMDTEEELMNLIKEFFETYPQGIIYFG